METVQEKIHALARRARRASFALGQLSTEAKNEALKAVADALDAHRGAIAEANARDLDKARAAALAPALIDRLTLDEARMDAMIAGVRKVVELPDPVGVVRKTITRENGLTIKKISVPLGVLAVVFESRPNVFVDTAALTLKSGNAVILRGGKEAFETNAALAQAVTEGLKSLASPADLADAVLFVDTLDHQAVTELVRAVGLVDVAIPRGGERLIRAMCEAALVPVLKHYKGVCHVYVDEKADLAMALSILDNAKTQRPGVCNAAECLLVHERLAPLFLPMVLAWAKDKGVRLHGVEEWKSGRVEECDSVEKWKSGRVEKCDGVETCGGEEIDWGREFLALEMNVGVVRDVDAAIEHINHYGSHHSDCIVTNDDAAARAFLRGVDSACVYHNVSTRFTDGAQFGMGAEIGISTDKLHARGPMGLEELTTYKYVITGDGLIRKG